MTRNNQILPLVILALAAVCVFADKKLYYLYDQEALLETPALKEIISNPYNISVMLINWYLLHNTAIKNSVKNTKLPPYTPNWSSGTVLAAVTKQCKTQLWPPSKPISKK
jgi:hypothetical protein